MYRPGPDKIPILRNLLENSMTTSENPFAAGKPEEGSIVQEEPESRPGGIPLYVWVIAAVLVAIPVGLGLG